LRQGLDDALKANLYVRHSSFICDLDNVIPSPMFTLKVEAAQKEIKDSIERSTETILQEVSPFHYFQHLEIVRN
jgi:hypothetical protein